eukprot:6452016-Amphidinium_carterae.1
MFSKTQSQGVDRETNRQFPRPSFENRTCAKESLALGQARNPELNCPVSQQVKAWEHSSPIIKAVKVQGGSWTVTTAPPHVRNYPNAYQCAKD